jgi:hypothetical protein
VNDRISLILHGGLGDTFTQMFDGGAYQRMADLRNGETAQIAILSHNPNVEDMWRWHPVKDRLLFRRLPWMSNYDDARCARALGVPAIHSGGYFKGYRNIPPMFYPAPEDLAVLAEVESELGPDPVLLFASAGSPDRNIPEAVLREIKLPWKVVAIGNTYGRWNREERRAFPIQVVDVINRLSVAGTCELVRRCAGLVTTHSAFNILAWNWRRKPQLLLYSEFVKRQHFDRGDTYARGQHYPATVHGTFADYEPGTAAKFIGLVEDYKRQRKIAMPAVET